MCENGDTFSRSWRVPSLFRYNVYYWYFCLSDSRGLWSLLITAETILFLNLLCGCVVVCCPSGRRSLWRSLTVSGMSCRSAGRRRTTPSSERTMSTTTPVSLFVLLISSSHFLCSTFYSPSLPSIITAPCHLYFLVADLMYVFKWSVVDHDCWTVEGVIV